MLSEDLALERPAALIPGSQMSDDLEDRGLSAAHIAKQIDASLDRLKTDYSISTRRTGSTARSRRRSKGVWLRNLESARLQRGVISD